MVAGCLHSRPPCVLPAGGGLRGDVRGGARLCHREGRRPHGETVLCWRARGGGGGGCHGMCRPTLTRLGKVVADVNPDPKGKLWPMSIRIQKEGCGRCQKMPRRSRCQPLPEAVCCPCCTPPPPRRCLRPSQRPRCACCSCSCKGTCDAAAYTAALAYGAIFPGGTGRLRGGFSFGASNTISTDDTLHYGHTSALLSSTLLPALPDGPACSSLPVCAVMSD